MNRFKLWNEWQKRNLNSDVYKLLVLLGICVSPTFELHCLTGGNESYIVKGIRDSLKEE